MAAPKPLAEPEKELRFTRGAQAQGYFIAAAVAFAGAVVFVCVLGHPSVSWLLPVTAAVAGAAFLRVALRCARHAYLILTPMGLELFPWRKPEEYLEVLFWSEIDSAEFSDEGDLMTLHFNAEKSAGLVISLAPVSENRRELLRKAVVGRMGGNGRSNNG